MRTCWMQMGRATQFVIAATILIFAAALPIRALSAESSPGTIFGWGVRWSPEENWNAPELRRAFLIGMMERSPFLTRDETGYEQFWPSETEASRIYDTVARAYARDLGSVADQATESEWMAAVARSLEPDFGRAPDAHGQKELVAYLAGVFARWGTETGFRFSGGRGHTIAGLLMQIGGINYRLSYSYGWPGGSEIVITGGDEATTAEIVAFLRSVAGRAALPANR